ncbi:hypothetical protein C1940_17300 (plasmid) [Lactiplantibacillus plantarum subsp. plantarum]|uniref:hypothetical protein n=1 Tax=Lactiplantibacillus plantarum TaxID=1590 RepID=UPI000CD36005|nr:hypothetical protein [Lactiplantibacillus plantarum]AUV74208.1 hypothetical protein C1940_17300 [Lactiplantibacillus plantarum subsp. plantarum]
MQNKIWYGSLSILLASIVLIELKVSMWPYFLLVVLVLFTLGTVAYVIEILRGIHNAGQPVIVGIFDVAFAIFMWFMNVFLQFKLLIRFVNPKTVNESMQSIGIKNLSMIHIGDLIFNQGSFINSLQDIVINSTGIMRSYLLRNFVLTLVLVVPVIVFVDIILFWFSHTENVINQRTNLNHTFPASIHWIVLYISLVSSWGFQFVAFNVF